MNIINTWKAWAIRLKLELITLYLAYLNPQTPIYAKVLAIFTVAYALSQIDLIPDFIPVIGYLDDLIIVPFCIFLSIRLIPRNILEDCRIKAKQEILIDKKIKWIGLIFILSIWALIVIGIIHSLRGNF